MPLYTHLIVVCCKNITLSFKLCIPLYTDSTFRRSVKIYSLHFLVECVCDCIHPFKASVYAMVYSTYKRVWQKCHCCRFTTVLQICHSCKNVTGVWPKCHTTFTSVCHCMHNLWLHAENGMCGQNVTPPVENDPTVGICTPRGKLRG